jgi:thiol-disulfide isomerase/thioredoxin
MICREHIAPILFTCFFLTSTACADGSLDPYPNAGIAPEFELRDLDKQLHRLSEYRGNVVLVNFWASWCVPCITEMPGMQRLADSLSDQPFEILAINVSDTENRIREFLRRMDLRLTILMDLDGEAFKSWQGRVLPASFLLDHSGRIRYQVIGPLEWDSDEAGKVIEELLQHPLKKGVAEATP